jgi:hypothetical protein
MMFTFAGTIASWIDDDWNLVDRVIDFRSIAELEHQGEYAARGFIKTAMAFNALEKICSSFLPL